MHHYHINHMVTGPVLHAQKRFLSTSEMLRCMESPALVVVSTMIQEIPCIVDALVETCVDETLEHKSPPRLHRCLHSAIHAENAFLRPGDAP
jgi:hypothetical protein